MNEQAVERIIRVAGIIAKDARQPENAARAQEIVMLAEMLKPSRQTKPDTTRR